MNANRMISMLIRMIMRRVMRHGTKKRPGTRGDSTGPDGQATAKRARRTLRAGRKIGRF